MRLNLYLRGIDLIDVEMHAGSKGLYLDVNWFKPRTPEAVPADPPELTADRSGTPVGFYERAHGPQWDEDQPALVQGGFGFR